jgi:hypothetical protein
VAGAATAAEADPSGTLSETPPISPRNAVTSSGVSGVSHLQPESAEESSSRSLVHGPPSTRAGSDSVSLTVADWLPGIRPHLAQGLLDDRGLQRVERVARHLPGACLSALEIPLPPSTATTTEAGADLSVRIRCPSEALELASRLPPGPSRDFLERWSESEPWRDRAPEVWLELDLVGAPEPPAEALPPPLVCARLAPGVEAPWLVEELLPGLHGSRSLPKSQRSAALAALSALPSSARPLYAFSLRSRRSGFSAPSRVPIRLEIYGLEAGQVTPYLTRVAGPKRAAGLSAQMSGLLPLVRLADRNHLSFDLAPDLQPRIGIELSFRGLPGREAGWSMLLDRVLEMVGTEEAAREGLRRAVRVWPGWSSFWTDPDTWPAAAGAGYCVRSLSHFKVVTWPDRKPWAKVYLLFGPWRRRGG